MSNNVFPIFCSSSLYFRYYFVSSIKKKKNVHGNRVSILKQKTLKDNAIVVECVDNNINAFIYKLTCNARIIIYLFSIFFS